MLMQLTPEKVRELCQQSQVSETTLLRALAGLPAQSLAGVRAHAALEAEGLVRGKARLKKGSRSRT